MYDISAMQRLDRAENLVDEILREALADSKSSKRSNACLAMVS